MRQKVIHEEFINKLSLINSNIEVLGQYKGSVVSIKVKCTKKDCYHVWKTTPNSLVNARKGCPRCANVKKKKKYSQFIIELKNINPYVLPLEEYTGTKNKIKCKCTRDDYEWYVTPFSLLQGTGCPKCAGNIKNTHKDFINRLKLVNPNIEVLSEYVSSRIKIKCRCVIDNHEWNATPSSLLKNHGCPACGRQSTIEKTTITYAKFIASLKEVNPNVEILTDYKNVNTEIKCRCLIDGYEWKTFPSSLLRGKGCSKCNSSKLESNTAKILSKLNIKYIEQHKFDNCRLTNALRFDFYLPEFSTCIECQGKQHYEPVDFSGKGLESAIEKFKQQQIKDGIKRGYCTSNSIRLISIPYWDINKIEEILHDCLKKCDY